VSLLLVLKQLLLVLKSYVFLKGRNGLNTSHNVFSRHIAQNIHTSHTLHNLHNMPTVHSMHIEHTVHTAHNEHTVSNVFYTNGGMNHGNHISNNY
jgi:hypothetical protein